MIRVFDRAGRGTVGHLPISIEGKGRGTGLHPGSEALRLDPQEVWSLGVGGLHHLQKSCPGQLGQRLGDRRVACSSPQECQDSVISVNKYGTVGGGGLEGAAGVQPKSQRPCVCVTGEQNGLKAAWREGGDISVYAQGHQGGCWEDRAWGSFAPRSEERTSSSNR